MRLSVTAKGRVHASVRARGESGGEGEIYYTHHPIRHAGTVHLVHVGDDQVMHEVEQHDQKRHEYKAVPMAGRRVGGG